MINRAVRAFLAGSLAALLTLAPLPVAQPGYMALLGSGAATSAAPPIERPDATNTGAILGPLTPCSGNVQSTANDEVIENIDCTGFEVRVIHTGVTLRNLIAQNIYLGIDNGGNNGKPAQNTLVEYCTVIGTGAAGTGGNTAITMDTFSTGSIVRHCNLSQVENGIFASSNDLTITQNYLHSQEWPGGAHIDGIQFFANETGGTITYNSIDAFPETSSLITTTNIQNFNISNNWLGATTGAVQVYMEGTLETVLNNTVSGNEFDGPNGGLVNSNGINLGTNNTITNNTFNGVLFPTGYPGHP